MSEPFVAFVIFVVNEIKVMVPVIHTGAVRAAIL